LTGLVVATSIVTILGVVLALWLWWSQVRKVPEVRFTWHRFGRGEVEWLPAAAEELEVGVPYRLRCVLTNVGTGPAAPVLVINVIVPSFMGLRFIDRQGTEYKVHTAQEVAVDFPPNNQVRFVVIRNEEFFPSMPVLVEVDVFVDRANLASFEQGRQHYVAISAEAAGMTPNGKRRLPSWAARTDAEHWSRREWPGPSYRREWRKIVTSPKESVRCGPGKRIDRRPFVVKGAG
jgi:hypothetical protein